jgi:hypothetical protein
VQGYKNKDGKGNLKPSRKSFSGFHSVGQRCSVFLSSSSSLQSAETRASR